MFRTVPLSIITNFSVYTQQRYMSYSFANSLRAGSGRSVLILLAICQQTCMTYTIAVFTAKNSLWWTEELSETCTVLFQKQIWEFSASIWFYYKNISRCTALWMSNSCNYIYSMDYLTLKLQVLRYSETPETPNTPEWHMSEDLQLQHCLQQNTKCWQSTDSQTKRPRGWQAYRTLWVSIHVTYFDTATHNNSHRNPIPPPHPNSHPIRSTSTRIRL